MCRAPRPETGSRDGTIVAGPETADPLFTHEIASAPVRYAPPNPMLDALAPIRHVYDVEPAGPPPTGAEAAGLAGVKALLDRQPALAPDAAVFGRVLARAAEATDTAEIPTASPVEAAVVDQSLRALDRLPQSRPDASVIAAVEARAAEAGASLVAVRAVYEGQPSDSVEAEVLRQSRIAVERSLASRPQPRPSAAVVEAVLARAAEASGVQVSAIPAEGAVEEAVLGQSLGALDRLPRPRPDAATLDAVRLAAATATGGISPDAPARPVAADRAAIRRPSRSRFGVWAGASALVMAALVAVFVLPTGSPVEQASEVAALADLAEPSAPATEEVAEPTPAPQPEPASTGPSASPLAAAAAVSGLVPVPEQARRPAPSAARTAPAQSAPAPAVQLAREADAAALADATPTDAPAWEASDDVRALSLRLQELDDALAWDEPAEAFGVPSGAAAGTAGVQAVRAGAPARARLRTAPDSTQR